MITPVNTQRVNHSVKVITDVVGDILLTNKTSKWDTIGTKERKLYKNDLINHGGAFYDAIKQVIQQHLDKIVSASCTVIAACSHRLLL